MVEPSYSEGVHAVAPNPKQVLLSMSGIKHDLNTGEVNTGFHWEL